MKVPPTIVLIDDSEDLRLVVRMNFERSTLFTVLDEGGSGRDAIRLASDLRPDVVLMDVSMPEMDGLEALPQVLSASPTSKVIMFTGFAQQGLRDRALELGALALVEKSFSLRALPAEVLRLLEDDTDVGVDLQSPPPVVPAVDPALALAQEQQERFQEVFEEAAIGMGTMTLAGRLVRANKSLVSLVGRDSPAVGAGSLVGLEYSSLLSRPDAETFDQLRASAVVAAKAETSVRDDVVYQFEHGLPGGDVDRVVRTTLAPVRDSAGKALYLFVQVQDVTEQHRIATHLTYTQQQLQLVVDTVDDAIIRLDPAGVIQSWNPGAARLYGYAGGEIVGSAFDVLFPPESRRLDHPAEVLNQALRDGRFEEEGWRVRADGSPLWANVVVNALRDASGQHVGFAKIARDVGERRRRWVEQEAAGDALGRVNADLRAENADLSEHASAQAQSVAVTAHELRSPVAVIADLAQTLQEETHDPAQAPLLQALASSSARLQRLVDDLLVAARLEAHAPIELDLRPVALGEVLEDTAQILRRRHPHTPITITSGRIPVDHPDREPAIGSPPKGDDQGDDFVVDDVVMADPDRIHQILDNMINNAIHHGRPPVRIGLTGDADSVHIIVDDDGPGVALDVQDRLFDRYVTTSRSGTGLGLYISRELARAHGGDIAYDSDNPGPSFIITLPRRQDRPAV